MSPTRVSFLTELPFAGDEPPEVRVDATYTPGLPEFRRGHPDNWAPAEGPEIELLDVMRLHADRTDAASVLADLSVEQESALREQVENYCADDADERDAEDQEPDDYLDPDDR